MSTTPRRKLGGHGAPAPADTVKTLARVKVVEEIGKVVRTAIVVGGAVAIAFYTRLGISDLAGRTTAADIGVRFLGTISISEGLAYAIAVVCVGVAYQKGRTNQGLSKRLGRLSRLEQSIDPNRSSSHLTDTGSPREEDK